MQRKVELFIHEGIVIEPAKDPKQYKDQDHYGRIVITSPTKGPDPNSLTAYTHFDHSFTDNNNQPPEGAEVSFFLVPMEYLFAKVPGSLNDTPLLAVNITEYIPYLVPIGNCPQNRHPCTTKTTIAPDSGSSQSSLLSLFLPIIPKLLKKWFHTYERLHYGMNDYGELTIIDTSTRKGPIEPWEKILLDDKHPWHSRGYSPKLTKNRRVEFKILKQDFTVKDECWEWRFQERVKKNKE